MRMSWAFMVVVAYQPFADSGATLVPPLRPSRSWGNTKTDLTFGRSVAL